MVEVFLMKSTLCKEVVPPHQAEVIFRQRYEMTDKEL